MRIFAGNNIVLTEQWSPVIIDFGRATADGDPKGKPRVRGVQFPLCRFNWIDPAVLTDKLLPCPASDIYSYGYLIGRVARRLT